MVAADSHLKLLFPSILDIYKVSEHINMLRKGILLQPYTVVPTCPKRLASFGYGTLASEEKASEK